jgi:hypothetical protein
LIVSDEFDGAGASVVDGAADGYGRPAHVLAQGGRHHHRGRLFDDLLVAALD